MLAKRFFRIRFQNSRDEAIWLTVYADLVTNIMLVFLALFGLTMMGEKALMDAVASIKVSNLDPEKMQMAFTRMDELEEALRDRFANLRDITISRETDAIRVQFGEDLLFESGQANPKSEGVALMSDLGTFLADVPYTVAVEGHTDAQPLIPGSRFKNNWDLSLARSMSIVRTLIKEGGVSSERIAAAAYGANKPRATNETSSGRAINRRVEIGIFSGLEPEQSNRNPEGGESLDGR